MVPKCVQCCGLLKDGAHTLHTHTHTVGLENPQLGAALGSRTSATMWIVNDDGTLRHLTCTWCQRVSERVPHHH